MRKRLTHRQRRALNEQLLESLADQIEKLLSDYRGYGKFDDFVMFPSMLNGWYPLHDRGVCVALIEKYNRVFAVDSYWLLDKLESDSGKR